MKKSVKIFTKQNQPTIGKIQDVEIINENVYITHPEIKNGYGSETMTFQVLCDGTFQLNVATRVNFAFPYEHTDIITDRFDIISSITESGVYTIGIGGRMGIEFQLLSIEPNATLDCFGNLY